MGLDMYLNKKTYIWQENRARDLQIRVGSPYEKIKPERIKYIVEEVGYWRKANAIHKWFVDHVQNGIDNCSEYCVTEENMRELLVTINKILRNHKLAPELLPTQSGFFFGDVAYNDWYFDSLKETKKIITEALAEGEDGDYYYESSW